MSTLIPTRPINEGEGPDIPAIIIEQMQQQIAALQADVAALNSATAGLTAAVTILQQQAKEEEHCFYASKATYGMDSNVWRVVGVLRVFEEIEVLSMSGFAELWEDNCSWLLVGLRSNGTMESQSVGVFTFNSPPIWNSLEFSNGDTLGILVRTYEEDGTTLDLDNLVTGSITVGKR